MTTLEQASTEWSSRPADERYSSLADIHAYVEGRTSRAVQTEVNYSDLKVEAVEDQLVLVGKSGKQARFSNWAFGQLASRVGAPAAYLRELTPQLAADCANEGLQKRIAEEGDEPVNLLLDRNGHLSVRAFTSSVYTRIWDQDITSRLIRLSSDHPEWQPAPPAFDESRGLYASDRDIFCFMVDNDRRIFEKGPEGGLSRGFFIANSEVGARSFWIMTFLYEYVCGNHRVWGATGVQELRIRHVGNADERAFEELTAELTKYADASAEDDELKIEKAMAYKLGNNKEEVIDAISGMKLSISRRLVGQAFDLAVQHADWYGDPHSAWGIAGGLTEVARDLPNADERVELERASGKVMQVSF